MDTLTETTQLGAWAQFLTFAEERLSAAEFSNWIEPISLVEESDDKVVLRVPNVFVQEYLIANYSDMLASFLPTDKTGAPLIEFRIEEEEHVRAAPFVSPAQEKKEEVPSVHLNTFYTFENFIEGTANQFVKSAAMGVAAKPGKSYNPLFIHGGVGLGKTHLLHGIGHYVMKHHRKLKIQCITTEGFINALVDHLRSKSTDKMKRYYRTLDLLLVDDIQFLQSRLNFEEELCNTFEALLNNGGQIVITSDKPPGQLKLSERMIARMEWGLVANVGIPDLETRVAILQHKGEQKGLTIPHEIAFFIAEHIFNNVRQLEGALNRLSAFCRLMNTPVTEDVVEQILGEFFNHTPQKKISVESILSAVASLFEVKVNDLKGTSRAKEVAYPRQVAMYLSKEMIGDSLSKLAGSFGGKTHSTLLHAWKKIAEQVEQDDTLRRQIQMIRRTLEK